MAHRVVLALGCLLALAGEVAANGRPPGTSSIHFRRGQNAQIVAGLSFGMIVSNDNGATWRWMCEDAIGYGGTYDPDYEFTTTGAVFATTFDGLQVMRDGCTFTQPLGSKFVSTVTQASNGDLFYGAADGVAAGNPGDAKIYRSTNDGQTWMAMAGSPGIPNDWWQSLEVAPSDPTRLYLAGYRFVPAPGGGGNVREFLFYRSDNAGATWTAINTSQIQTMSNSMIEIAGISHTNPNVVFARVVLADNVVSEAIYKSTNGGTSWTKVLEKLAPIAFLVRRSGEVVAATLAQGAFRSPTGDANTWVELTGAPHMNCLVENDAGEVWACTQNYGGMQAPRDGYGIMKSTNLTAWTPVVRYEDIREPVPCGEATKQYARCQAELWCGLCDQLGCSKDALCAAAAEADPPTDPDKPGCCHTSAGGGPGVAAVFGVAGLALLLLPRRRRGRAR